MHIYSALLIACWAVFVAYWLFASFSAKRTRSGWLRGVWLRIVLAVIVVSLLQLSVFQGATFQSLDSTSANVNPALGILGILLTALGVAYAIWARVYLGRNWGMPMTLKESPELVTGGPYAYVRHPIYTGAITAMVGSGLISPAWLVVALVFSSYFIYSAHIEEKLMLKEFPNQYPQYMRRTKMLVPFIF